jgi:hypothetical protein
MEGPPVGPGSGQVYIIAMIIFKDIAGKVGSSRQSARRDYRPRLNSGARSQGEFPDDNPPSRHCQVAATFPDGTSWNGPCLISIIRAGEMMLAPRGVVRILDPDRHDEVLSISFYPPKEIKANVPYPLLTNEREGFLMGLIQPLPGQENCHMNHQYPSKGTVTFTAVGTTSVQFHGTLEAFPTCTIYQGTPQSRMVPGGTSGGGNTVVTF